MFTFCWFFLHFLLLPFSLFFVFGLIQLGHEKYNWYSTRQFIFIGFTFQCKYNNSFRRCAHWEWVDNWIANYRFYHFFYTFLSLTSMHDEAHLDMMEHFFDRNEPFFEQKWSIFWKMWFSLEMKHFLHEMKHFLQKWQMMRRIIQFV